MKLCLSEKTWLQLLAPCCEAFGESVRLSTATTDSWRAQCKILQFTISCVSGLSRSVYQLWVRNYYSHIIELWVCPHLQKRHWLMDLLVEQAHTLPCGAETLVQERLPPELVPKAVLDTAIQKLSIKVRESYPDYILVTETISTTR